MVVSLIIDMDFKPQKHVLSSELGDSIILLDIDKGEYYELKGTSVLIWHELELGKSSDQIIEKLSMDFQDTSEIKKDVQEFITDLLRRGLLVEVEN